MDDSMKTMALRSSRLLKAMSNHRRIAILNYLSLGEHSVSQLCDLVGLSQSALSQHLARLRREKLVKTRRDAQTVYYSLAGSDVQAILDALGKLYGHPLTGSSAARPESGIPQGSQPTSKANGRSGNGKTLSR